MNQFTCNRISKKRITVILILIIVSACFAVCCVQSQTYAFDNQNIATASVSVGELLLNDYASRSDGYAFDGKKLIELFGYIANGSGTAKLSDLTSKGSINAQDIRDKIYGEKDIVVTFGGYQWTVTYVTQDRNGNTIVSLWLASSTETCKWNLWASDHVEYDYPSNMYSTSYIRAKALNSGGCGYVESESKAYGASKALNTSLGQSTSHKFAKFTMSDVPDDSGNNLSLIDYIVQPINVEYQQTQTIVAEAPLWNTVPNEAYGTPSIENYYTELWDYSKKTHYTEWAEDYIWLPCYAETGIASQKVHGIWNLSNNQRSNSIPTWVRGTNYEYVPHAYLFETTGINRGGGTIATADAAVRPALHLNLTKAVADATTPVDVPADCTRAYNGVEQAFVYDAKLYSIANVQGVDPLGNTIGSGDFSIDSTSGTVTVKNAGTYTVELNLKNNVDTFWYDATGGTGMRKTKIILSPKQLSITLDADTTDSLWEWTVRDPYKATLTVSGIASGDTIGLKAIYTADSGGAKQEIAATQDGTQTVATIDLSQIPIGTYKLTAALDNTVGQSINYSISDGLTSANMPRPFTVRAKTADLTGVGWLHTVQDADGNPIAGQPNLEEIADGAQFRYALHGTLQNYAAYVHRMNIDASKFPKDGDNPIVTVDVLTTSFNGTTYADGYSNALGSTVNRYTSKVLLKIVHDDYLFDNNQKQIELSLNWEVLKGTFDLSGVKWKYKYTTDTGTVSNVYDPDTTKLEYNDGKVIRVEIDPTTLPLGLSAPGGIFDYQNASGTLVNAYTATVAGNTLEYDDACFEQPADLVLNWEILGKGIVVKWKPVQSGTYYLKELNCDPKYTTGESKIVHYKYFAPDGSLLGIDEAGRQAIADKVIADNIGPENPQTFTIEAYLDGNNSGNYRLLTDPARTTVSIGNDPFTAVEAKVPETATYDGNAHYTQDDIQFMGAPIRPTDYTVTYYAGTDVSDLGNNTKLDGAPTDAGKYVIAIEMTDESYLLNRGVFAIEILPKQIAVPTVKEAMFNGTEYSLLDLLTGYDAALMTLDLVTTATNAGTYHATVTLPNSNYVWATADGATGSQEYALEWSISKVKLTEIWGTDSNGKPTLSVSSKYADYVQIVYEYYDANGNLVAEADLVAGQSYKVVAKLSASSAANFELADVNGDVSDTPSESAPKQFVYGNDPNNPSGSGNNDGNATVNGMSEPWFKIVMIAIAIGQGGSFIVLIAIWMAVMSIRRARKKKA